MATTISATPPNAPAIADFWYNSESGFLYIYYDDGNTIQWVVANPGRGSSNGAPGPVGPQGPAGPSGGVMASREDANVNVPMANDDGEVVLTNSSPVAVTLPGGQVLGGTVRVSDGVGTNREVSISADAGGTIDGQTGALIIDIPWEVTTLRCLGGNAWSIV